MEVTSTYIAPSLFVNHGGGPNPVLGEIHNLEIAKSLREVNQLINFNVLQAIILVTAHWETDVVSISSNEHHDLLYDYTNYPPETYHYKYNARGHPVLARKISEALSKANITSTLDDQRGWDHGVFIPMMLIRPEADIPIVQVSILKNQDAKQHYEIGKVLHEFRKDGIAIIGSGLSYHNMRRFSEAILESGNAVENEEFNDFLTEVCTGDEKERKRIFFWEQQPGAYASHPKGEADHLMPLVVNMGAGGSSKGRKVTDAIFEIRFRVSGFIWE